MAFVTITTIPSMAKESVIYDEDTVYFTYIDGTAIMDTDNPHTLYNDTAVTPIVNNSDQFITTIIESDNIDGLPNVIQGQH